MKLGYGPEDENGCRQITPETGYVIGAIARTKDKIEEATFMRATMILIPEDWVDDNGWILGMPFQRSKDVKVPSLVYPVHWVEEVMKFPKE